MAARGTRGTRGGVTAATTPTTYSQTLAKITEQEEAAKTANLQRYEQAMAIYDEIIARYRPGGEFGKAALGQLEQRKVLDVGKETQQLISSGLYGTTTMGATGRRWEEAVGGPERLKLEDIQMQRLSQAQVGKAGFMERREDIGPDPSLVAQLSQQVGAAPRQTTGVTTGQSLSDFMEEFRIKGREGAAPRKAYVTSGGGTGYGPGAGTPGAKQGEITLTPTYGGAQVSTEDTRYEAARAAWAADAKAQGVDIVDTSLAKYKSLLASTPRNVKRGVWKAWEQAGGGATTPTQQTTAAYKPPKYSTGYGSPTAKF